MTHACTTLITASPVCAAIAAHRMAYDAFQVAPEGEASEHAEAAYDDASMALVTVACASVPEALELFRHLAWWVLDEAEYASGHQPAYDIAMARAKDLSLYLNALTGPTQIPQAMPSGRLPRAAVPSLRRLLATAGVAGEFVTAVLIIAGGVAAYGYLPL